MQDHLARRLRGDVEGDITENFAADILILSSFGMFTGHDGVRESAAKLADMVGDALFHYNRTLIQRDYAPRPASISRSQRQTRLTVPAT